MQQTHQTRSLSRNNWKDQPLLKVIQKNKQTITQLGFIKKKKNFTAINRFYKFYHYDAVHWIYAFHNICSYYVCSGSLLINSAIDAQNVKRPWSKVKTQNLSSQWPNCQCGNLTVSRDYRVHGSDPLLNVPCPHHFFVNGGREPGNEVLDIWPLEHTTLMSKRTQTNYTEQTHTLHKATLLLG